MTNMLARLRELEAQATPAPWRMGGHPNDDIVTDDPIDEHTNVVVCEHAYGDDGPFIVEVRNALPLLLDVAEQFRTLVGDFEWMLGQHPEHSGRYAENRLAACDELLARLRERTPSDR